MTRILWKPNPGSQVAFLCSPARESLIGGAVSGGKSDALIMAPLRWAAHPKHRAILLRREKEDLREVIDRARLIYNQVCPGATWVESRSRFEFPSGAFIEMGFAQHEKTIEQFKTLEYNLVEFDELTTFSKYMYTYMFSRNRSKAEDLPLQIRAGTNPDGVGHEWVYNRFVKNREPWAIYRRPVRIGLGQGQGSRTVITSQQFIPSTVFDNPSIPNRDQYIAGMMSMGKQLAEALVYGRWDYFRGQMFPYGMAGGLVETEPGIKGPHYTVRCLDYGWTDPTVIYWLVVYPQLGGRLSIEVAAELTVTETSVSNICLMAKRVEDRLRKAGVRLPCTFSVADPSIRKVEGSSQRSLLDLFQQHGLWFEKAINDRQMGWAQLRLYLEVGQIAYWRGSAPWLVSTMPKLLRDPAKADDLLPKQKDHWADTLRYGVMCVYSTLGLAPSVEPQLKPGQDELWPQLMKHLAQPGRDDIMDELGEGW